MPRKSRGEVADSENVQVFHLIQRCVRRAWLCGEDALSGQSYEHRRSWIRSRLEFFASIFPIVETLGSGAVGVDAAPSTA